MAWRHHDSSVAVPFLGPREYNASDIAKLREDSEGKVITMAEFLRISSFKGYKVFVGCLLPPSTARVTHLASPAKREKEKEAEEKVVAMVPAINIEAEMVVNKDAGREGPRKKKRVRVGPQVHPDSEHVSSPTPLNHAKPLEALVNEEHVYPPFDKGCQGNADASFAIEGHEDNQGGLSGLQTRPSPAHHSGRCLDTVEEPGHENVVLEMEASKYFRFLCFLLCNPVAYVFLGYFIGRFGNLPLLLNGGSRIQATWITRSAQQQANTLLHFETLKEQYTDLFYAHESCKDVKARYKECKKELAAVQSAYDELEELEEEKKEADQLNSSSTDRIKQLKEALKKSEDDAHQLRVEKERYAVEAGRGEMARQRIINQYLPTFVRRLHQSAEYKRSLGEVFSLAVSKGFIDGISIGREDADIQAILKATPNVDPASSNTFMDAYVKLFDKRYPYVDKVARMYLLDTSGLQNIMPDEIG
ncbi:hypothetical protein Tco_1287417, partial [Tanacetum coccineum]